MLAGAAPFDTERMVTISLSVVDADKRMGLLSFAEGSHNTKWSGWDLQEDRIQAAFKVEEPTHMAAGRC